MVDRVRGAAAIVLKRDKSVGPIELLVQLQFLSRVDFDSWKRGNPECSPLVSQIQCGEKKLRQTYTLFQEWVEEENLEAFEVSYQCSTRSGPIKLTICAEENQQEEAFFSTHFRAGDISETQKARIEKKKNKTPDIVVFQRTGDSSSCTECSDTIETGDLFLLEKQQPLCLACSDLDHLEFLAAGDATLTRRSRKHSPLSAIVTRFNRRRKRYDRIGILVTSQAIDAAHLQNKSDEVARAKLRERAAARRQHQDHELVESMTKIILAEFPSCPSEEAVEIAAHTAERGSGRVGRSAAGRSLDANAIQLAVAAWVRHQHTEYDQLLMGGMERQMARRSIKSKQLEVLENWQKPGP